MPSSSTVVTTTPSPGTTRTVTQPSGSVYLTALPMRLEKSW